MLIRRQASQRRYLISAGGTVVQVRFGSRHARHERPGDRLLMQTTLVNGVPTATSVQSVGAADLLELEGIYLGSGEGTLRLAVAHRGEVTVVPAGMLPKRGRAIWSSWPSRSMPRAARSRWSTCSSTTSTAMTTTMSTRTTPVRGTIAALDAKTISVQPGATAAPVSCDVPAGAELGSFKVGDRVEMECRAIGTALTLTKLRLAGNGDHGDDDDDDDDDDDGDHDD